MVFPVFQLCSKSGCQFLIPVTVNSSHWVSTGPFPQSSVAKETVAGCWKSRLSSSHSHFWRWCERLRMLTHSSSLPLSLLDEEWELRVETPHVGPQKSPFASTFSTSLQLYTAGSSLLCYCLKSWGLRLRVDTAQAIPQNSPPSMESYPDSLLTQSVKPMASGRPSCAGWKYCLVDLIGNKFIWQNPIFGIELITTTLEISNSLCQRNKHNIDYCGAIYIHIYWGDCPTWRQHSRH